MVVGNITNIVPVVDTNNNQIIGTTSVVAPAIQTNLITTKSTNYINGHISLNSGLILLNPYRLTTNGLTGDTTGRRAIDKGDGTQAKFFIDLAVNYVWAWDTARRERFAEELNKAGGGGLFLWQKNGKRWEGAIPLDIQTHISYYAKDSSDTTASAIVGSGNFGGEVTLGLPIYRALYTKNGSNPKNTKSEDLYNETESVHWFGVVGSYSGVTDSESFNVHSRYLLGVGYRAAYPSFGGFGDSDSKNGERPREFVLSVTLGAAGVDSVQFLNNTSREIKMHHGDVPDYTVKPTFALEMEAYYPLNSSLSAVLGSRLYPNLDPGMWNAYAGVTIPLDKIAALFKD